MRIYFGLPKIFWANIVNTTTYSINRGRQYPWSSSCQKGYGQENNSSTLPSELLVTLHMFILIREERQT